VNPLLRLLVGSGQPPPDLRAAVVAEHPVLLAEGLTGSTTLRRFRNGRSVGSQSGSGWYEKRAISGAIAISPVRLVVWAGRFKHIDVPLDHPMLATIEIRSDRPGQVTFGYDAGATNPSRSGQVEVRLRTEQAARVIDLLTRRP
jgi:hypothetical protein